MNSDSGKVIEDPEPGGGAVGDSGQLPVDEPERADFFQVGVQAARAEEQIAEGGWADGATPIIGNVRVFLQDARHQPPVANRSHHVLADAEGHEGIVLQENILPLAGGIHRLLEPAVPERKRSRARQTSEVFRRQRFACSTRSLDRFGP